MITSPTRLAVLASLFFTSCFPSPEFKRAQLDAALTYIPEKDEFVLLEVERDIRITLEKVSVLPALVGGLRVYPPEGGFPAVYIDKELERVREEAAEGGGGDEPETLGEIMDARLLGLMSTVEVLEAGVFKEGETLCFYRLSRAKKASAWIDCINDLINLSLAEDLDKYSERNLDAATQSDEMDLIGAPLCSKTLERWEARVRAGEPWIELLGPGLRFSLPMNGEEAAGLMRSALENAQEDEEYFQLRRFLSAVIADGEELVVSFQPPADGYFRLPERPALELKELGPGTEEHAKVMSTLAEGVGFVSFDLEGLLERFGYAGERGEGPR